MQFSPTDAESLQQIMIWRRDVRHFRADPLSPQLKQLLREAVELAPSVGNARPWRFVEVDQPHLRTTILADHLQAKHAANTYGTNRSRDYEQLKLAGIDQAPWQLAVFCDPNPVAGSGLGRHTMPEALEQSVVMAIHTLWLAARAQNIGMGLVSIINPANIQEILDVPRTWTFVSYICLGIAEFNNDHPLLHQLGWQRNISPTWEKR